MQSFTASKHVSITFKANRAAERQKLTGCPTTQKLIQNIVLPREALLTFCFRASVMVMRGTWFCLGGCWGGSVCVG